MPRRRYRPEGLLDVCALAMREAEDDVIAQFSDSEVENNNGKHVTDIADDV